MASLDRKISPLQQAFRDACQTGNLPGIQSCILQDEDGILRDEFPRALFMAIVTISIDVIQHFLAHGGDQDSKKKVKQLATTPYVEKLGPNDATHHYPLLTATKLDLVDAVEVIIASCDPGEPELLRVVTPQDEIFRVGTVPLFFAAQRNILHVAVHEHSAATLRRLLLPSPDKEDERPPLLDADARNLLLAQKDADGVTPMELAMLRPNANVGGGGGGDGKQQQKQEASSSSPAPPLDAIVAILAEATNCSREHLQRLAPTDADRKQYVTSMRARVTAAVELRRKTASSSSSDYRTEKYQWGSGEEEEKGDGECCCDGDKKKKIHVAGGNKNVPLHGSSNFATGFDAEKFVNSDWRDTVEEICPCSEGGGVWKVKLLTDEAVKLLRGEIDSVEKFYAEAAESGMALTRPNSMNNYGFVLGQVGLGRFLSDLVHDVLEEVASFQPAATHRGWHESKRLNGVERKQDDDDAPDKAEQQRQNIISFRSVHAFTIKYALGQDTALATHVDDSDFTFNICLGDSFQGATLYFHGEPPEDAIPPEQRGVTSPNDAAIMYGKRFTYDHQVGTAVIHRGTIPHGAEQLTQGERVNLVVWAKEAAGGYGL